MTFLRGRDADCDTVGAPRPADRAWRFHRQLWLLPTLRPGEVRAAQLPHHGDMIGELALEPGCGDKQFSAPGLLAEEACRFREFSG